MSAHQQQPARLPGSLGLDSTTDYAWATVATSTNPPRLTKLWRLDDSGQPVKVGAGNMLAGHVARVAADHASDLARLLTALEPNQALIFGVPDGYQAAPITTADRLPSAPAGTIARTADAFSWHYGPGWMMFDYDPAPGAPALSRDEWLTRLFAVAPELGRAPRVWSVSSGSEVWNAQTGKQITGTRGQRLYIKVADARDIPRAGAVLFDRLWLAGHGYFAVSKSGALLARADVDASVWQPNRLDFAATPVCEAPLETRRPTPIIWNDDAPAVDTLRVLPDLGDDERAALALIRARLSGREDLLAEQRKSQDGWIADRLAENPHTAREALRAAVMDRRLPGDIVLIHSSGRRVTVSELLADREHWDGERFADPLEPDYSGGDSRIAWANLRGEAPFIFSHAHGGVRYQLAANPALPIFTDLASLPRVELAGRDQSWFNKLAKEAEPLQAAAVAWAICRKRAITIPVQTTLDELLERIETCADDRLHPETVATMGRALTHWTNQRQARALSHVTVSPPVLRRHQHEVCVELPELGADDYQGVILLWAPMASGKTQRIGKPFAEWARQHGRFIATCHRRSLVAEMAKRLDCDHYAEVSPEAACSVFALATCLPSITKGAHRQIVEECAYLFVDEIAQVLRFLESDKTCRTEEGTNADVYQRLRDLVSRARCIIGADAGMDDRVVQFLEECRRPGEQFRIIEMKPQREGLTASIGYGANAVAATYGEMCARVADGQRIWVSCESERRVTEVAKLLETAGANVLAITASNRGNEKQAAFWKDPEGVSRLYDAVVHSPVISSGLSIEHKQAGAWFDHGFFIGGGHAITPADAAQMMRRVRYLRRWSVALVTNSARGMDNPEVMLQGMEAAAAIEGTAAAATNFDAFVAGIRADNNSARADFAAGLLWVLQRAGFTADRLPMHADAIDADELKQLRAEMEAERRAAIMAAPDLADDDARRLRSAEHRTQEQSDALVKHSVRQALSAEALTDEALDVWDDGRGPHRLDRFSAAVFGLAERNDDAQHMTQRRFTRARVAAYRALFEDLEIRPGLRIDDADAERLISRVIEHRHLLAWLGIVPSRFGAFTGKDEDGEQKPFPMPKAPQKDVGEIFRAMGLELKRRRNRHTGAQWYELGADAYQTTAQWAERRNSPRSGVITLEKNTGSGTVRLAREAILECAQPLLVETCEWIPVPCVATPQPPADAAA